MQRLFSNLQFLLVAYILISFVACNSEMHTQREIIKGMEQAVKKNTSDDFLRPLIANYLNYSKDFAEDEMAPIYLYRCAVLYFRLNNISESTIHLESILRDHPETEILEDTYLFLAMLYAGRAGNPKRAETLYKEYMTKYPEGKGRAAAEYFFRPAEEKLEDHINEILKEINNLPRGTAAPEGLLSQLMFAYANYVKANPDAPLAPSYCLKGAQIATRLDLNLIAIQFLDKIYRDYPDFQDYPQSMLMLAVEYDSNITLYLRKGKNISSPLNDNISAPVLLKMDLIAEGGRLYKEIIQRFPNHEIAESAKNGLKNLGKKTNEVVEEFIRVQDSIKVAHQRSPQ